MSLPYQVSFMSDSSDGLWQLHQPSTQQSAERGQTRYPGQDVNLDQRPGLNGGSVLQGLECNWSALTT